MNHRTELLGPQCGAAQPDLASKAFAGLLAGALFTAVSTAASASDLPSRTEPPVFTPPPAEFSWTGFYAGVNVGGGVDHFGFKYFMVEPRPNGLIRSTSGITASGPVGGIQAGFNYELPFFHIVAGLEFDINASGIGGQTTVGGAFPNGAPATATFGSKYESFGTGRLRLGYAWGRFLPYLTAGFSFGVIETYYSFFTPGFSSALASTSVRSGVFPHVGALGIGLEYAVMPNVTVKAEYLYNFINTRPVTISPGDGTTISFGTRTMYHIARIGLNYKFDWLLPPAVIKD